MSDATLLATAHSQVMASQHYPEAWREWERMLAEALVIFDPAGYCHTHGYRVHASHTSAKCKKKKKGHKNEATRANTMGGSNRNQGWETNPNPM